LHLEHCSSGGASVLPQSALLHASAAAPAAGVAASHQMGTVTVTVTGKSLSR